jgi:hypothetical protein
MRTLFFMKLMIAEYLSIVTKCTDSDVKEFIEYKGYAACYRGEL